MTLGYNLGGEEGFTAQEFTLGEELGYNLASRIESHISWLKQELDDLDTELRLRISTRPVNRCASYR